MTTLTLFNFVRNKTSLVVCVLGENTAGANLDQLLDDIRDGVGKAINALRTDVGEEVPTLLLGTLGKALFLLLLGIA